MISIHDMNYQEPASWGSTLIRRRNSEPNLRSADNQTCHFDRFPSYFPRNTPTRRRALYANLAAMNLSHSKKEKAEDEIPYDRLALRLRVTETL